MSQSNRKMGIWSKSALLTTLALCTVFLSFGQTQNTSDWIQHDQNYYKIRVAADGIYKIEKAALELVGLPVKDVNDENYHLIVNGREIPIHVSSTQIVFYGEKAKGDLDLNLYEDAKNQAHQEFSIYTDTAYYYLTYNSVPGLRYTLSTNSDISGLSAVNRHRQEQIIAFDDLYREGERLNPVLFHPDMAKGEGPQSSNAFRSNSFVTARFDVSDKIDGTTGTLKTRVCGTNNNINFKADSFDAHGNIVKSFNNHAVIEALNGGWQQLDHRYFRGYTSQGFNIGFTDAHIDAGQLLVRGRADETYEGKKVLRGSFSVSHFGISYDAKFRMLDQKLSHFRFDRASINRYVRIENFVGANAIALDIGNAAMLKPQKDNSDLLIRTDKGAHHHHLVVADAASVKALTPQRHRFNKVDVPAGTDFLIITHRSLASSVAQYAQYRSSVSGGGRRVEVLYVDDIFDGFYFGYHHPLALKELFKELIADGINPENVFLIGKGIDVKHLKKTGVFDYSQDLVPSIGSPSTDWYYLRYVDPGSIAPPFVISRLSASSNQTVLNYLEKVKTYEALSNEGWRKNVIHISGGKTASEIKTFAHDMQVLGEVIEGPSMGAAISYFGKESNLTIDTKLTDLILEEVNSGVGMVSYLGHAGSNSTEVDIATPERYTNSKSPMVMYLGGCVLGSCYEQQPLLGETFIGATTGAVSWIASGSFSFQQSVYNFTEDFYDLLSSTHYGEPVAHQIRHTIEGYIVEGSEQNEAQSWFTLVQGDPLIRVFSPEFPDYSISNTDIFIGPENVTAQSKSFDVNIAIQNLGKAVNRSFDVAYALTLPSGLVLRDTISVSNIHNIENAVFTVANKSKEFGNYSVQIDLDIHDSIAESNENNNSATYRFNLLKNGAFGLFPPNYGIVNTVETELTGQSLDINSIDNVFMFELDTTPYFQSPWRKRSGELSGGLIGNWKIQLLPNDSQAYYWRIRMKLKDGQLSPWSEKSFSYIKNAHNGWAQVDFQQLQASELNNIYSDSVKRNFNFYLNTSDGHFRMANHGRNYPEQDYYVFGKKHPDNDNKIIRDNKGAQLNGERTYNGMVCAVFDPNPVGEKFIRYSDHTIVSPRVTYKNGEYQFDWMLGTEEIDPDVIAEFISFLDNVPEGYHILAYSGYYHRIGDMPDPFYRALEAFGSSEIRDLGNDDIWLFAGTKGLNPGQARDEQSHSDQYGIYDLSVSFPVTKTSGNISSTAIGPSRKWRHLDVSTLNFNSEHALRDNSYTIWGLRLNGDRTALVENFSEKSLDLSFIDSKQYPYLQIELSTYNQVEYVPAQPRSWIVQYDYLPEGLINSEIAYEFDNDTIQKGQVLNFEIGYQNISNLSFENVLVEYSILDKHRNVKYSETDTLKALAPGESTLIKKNFNSETLKGDNKLIVLTNPGLIQPEQYAFNNNFEKSFFVQGDYELPSVEVTFDGHRILNGSIVSPSPTILISGKDNNSFFLLDDPGYFQITLEYPDSGVAQEIFGYSPNATFYPALAPNEAAKMEYTPDRLPDGVYHLTVQLTDANGNTSGREAYRVQFEVIGASTISNFYPYPNPFSSEMRFVFTLTGDQTPDNIVIQILTVSGKVVREIHQSELGPVKIGHNISDFAWDGTDMYGNKLANGVYLYRVKTAMKGEQMKHRSVGNNGSQGDITFKEGFGKIYILR